MPNLIAGMRTRTTTLTAVLVFLLSLMVFVLITPRFMRSTWFAAPTGDEPYYLLMADSLIRYHTIEQTRSFENKDYFHYYPGELYPRHEARTIYPGLWSKHAPGVSVLILPAYALDDWQGAVIFYNVVGALLAANIYLLAYEISRKQWVALLLWLTFSFTNPLMSYTFLIFPALVSALFAIYAFRRIRLDGLTAPLTGNGPLRMLAIGVCLGYMPWLHARFIPVSLSLFLYLVWREWAARRRAATSQIAQGEAGASGAADRSYSIVQGRRLILRAIVFLIPLAAGAASLLAYFKILYGTFMPNYGDHAGLGSPPEWVVAFFGGFLDQQWGLFIYAPIFILAIVGIILMFRQQKRSELFWLAVIAVPYSIVILTYKQWWGEWCPPARYWVSLLPLAVVPLAYMLAGPIRARFMVLYLLLAGVSWAIMAIFMYDPHLMYNHPSGSSRLFEWIAGSEILQPFFPTYFRAEWSNVWLTVIYVEIVIFIVRLGWGQVKRAMVTPAVVESESTAGPAGNA